LSVNQTKKPATTLVIRLADSSLLCIATEQTWLLRLLARLLTSLLALALAGLLVALLAALVLLALRNRLGLLRAEVGIVAINDLLLRLVDLLRRRGLHLGLLHLLDDRRSNRRVLDDLGRLGTLVAQLVDALGQGLLVHASGTGVVHGRVVIRHHRVDLTRLAFTLGELLGLVEGEALTSDGHLREDRGDHTLVVEVRRGVLLLLHHLVGGAPSQGLGQRLTHAGVGVVGLQQPGLEHLLQLKQTRRLLLLVADGLLLTPSLLFQVLQLGQLVQLVDLGEVILERVPHPRLLLRRSPVHIAVFAIPAQTPGLDDLLAHADPPRDLTIARAVQIEQRLVLGAIQLTASLLHRACRLHEVGTHGLGEVAILEHEVGELRQGVPETENRLGDIRAGRILVPHILDGLLLRLVRTGSQAPLHLLDALGRERVETSHLHGRRTETLRLLLLDPPLLDLDRGFLGLLGRALFALTVLQGLLGKGPNVLEHLIVQDLVDGHIVEIGGGADHLLDDQLQGPLRIVTGRRRVVVAGNEGENARGRNGVGRVGHDALPTFLTLSTKQSSFSHFCDMQGERTFRHWAPKLTLNDQKSSKN